MYCQFQTPLHRDLGLNMSLPHIAITMGDPVGVGPEIILKALVKDEIYSLCIPHILGDKGILISLARRLSMSCEDEGGKVSIGYKKRKPFIDSISYLDVSKHRFGHPSDASSRAAVKYIEEGARLALSGDVDAIVTCPINKEALSMIGFSFPGHTEFLAHLTDTDDYVMMMANAGLRVSLVTIHCSIRDAIDGVTVQNILKTIRITYSALKTSFSINSPRIAVAGINPHAGEGGLFGDEESQIILPAIEKARTLGIDASGPLPPDTVFYRARKGEFDAVIAMYHDQGLIPIKLLSFGGAVNITLGLPIIRTSVDHGTAYDIAGKGVADESSLIEAVRLAAQMALNKTI